MDGLRKSIRAAKAVMRMRHVRGHYGPRIATPEALSMADAELLAALEDERDPPLTEREWAQEEGRARARYAHKGSGA